MYDKELYTNNPAIKLIEERTPSDIHSKEYMAYHFGPAHLVVEDENLEGHHIEFCMEAVFEIFSKGIHHHSFGTGTWTVGEKMKILGEIYLLLEDLLKIPEEERLAGLYTPPDWEEE